MRHTKPKSFVMPLIILTLAIYGGYRVYCDWLSVYVKAAFEYIDKTGAAFWICLLVAGVVVWVVDRVIKKGEDNNDGYRQDK
mgnify:CR=1 FL=1